MNTQVSTKNSQQLEDFAALFNQFFFDLQAIFPAWRQAFPTTEHLTTAKRNWYAALRENKITSVGQINTGLRRARAEGSDFFPSPAKFVGWCKPQPEDFGLPSLDDAYREAIDNSGRIDNRHWTHRAVYHAAMQVGLGSLAVMNANDAWKAFSHAYELTVKAVMRGEQLPDVPRAIAKAEPVKARKEVAEAHLADMRRLLGSTTQSKASHRVGHDDPLLKNEADAA